MALLQKLDTDILKKIYKWLFKNETIFSEQI